MRHLPSNPNRLSNSTWTDRRALRRQRGATLTSYSLVISLIAVVSLGGIAALESGSTSYLTGTGSSIGSPRDPATDLSGAELDGVASTYVPAPATPATGQTPGGATYADTFSASAPGDVVAFNGLCLERSGTIKQKTCDPGDDKQDLQIFVNDTTGESVLVLDGECLEPASNTEGASVEARPCADTADQNWSWEPATSRWVHVSTGMCLDVDSSSTSEGEHIIIYGCHGNANQQWTNP